MLVENADDETAADSSLLRIIARAHHIQVRLIQNPKLTVHDIAREEQVSAAYLYSLLRLPWLAPDITTAIINGRKPPHLTAQTLMRLTPRLPAGWAEQRTLLGFRWEQIAISASSRLQSLWLRLTSAAPPAKKVNHEMAPERFS
jgi:site-specific DNA recombinase